MDAVADYLREKLTTTKNNLSETIATGSSENSSWYNRRLDYCYRRT